MLGWKHGAEVNHRRGHGRVPRQEVAGRLEAVGLAVPLAALVAKDGDEALRELKAQLASLRLRDALEPPAVARGNVAPELLQPRLHLLQVLLRRREALLCSLVLKNELAEDLKREAAASKVER